MKLAALPGKFMLGRNKPLRALIDNSVLRHGLTHTNEWISTGTGLWGDDILVETGRLARVPRRYPKHQSAIYENEVPYFAPLAELGRSGYIKFFDSLQLQIEGSRQPNFNRFQFGLNVWSFVPLEQLPEIPGTHRIEGILSRDWATKENQIDRLLKVADPEFLELSHHVSRKNILDFYHVWTAKHGLCEIFLTTDARFTRTFESLPQSVRTRFGSVSVKTPSELGKKLGLHPVPHQYLTPLECDSFYEIP